MMEVPTWGFKNTGQFTGEMTRSVLRHAPRDLRDIRMSELRKAAMRVAEYLEAGQVSQTIAEEVLDLLYGELNRRLQRNEVDL